MDILNNSIVEAIRNRYATPTAETVVADSDRRKGVMSRTMKQVDSAMEDTAQDALASVAQLMRSTREARTFEDRETPSLDYYQGEDIDSTVDAKIAADNMRDSMPDMDAISVSDGKDDQESAPVTAETGFDFETTSTRLMKDLKKDFGLNGMQAAALVGNLAVETDNFKALQEYNPVVKGSRGGYGFAMWTGERRNRYEAWAKENEVDPASYEANYGYLKYELSNRDPEIENMGRNTIKRLKKATDINEATKIVMKGYLRPGIPHLNKRQASAAAILGMTE